VPGAEHANELVSWGAFALVALGAAVALSWFLLRASWNAHGAKLDEIVKNNRDANSGLKDAMKDLADKFDHALERVRSHDTELAVRKKGEDDLTARVIYLEGEMRLVRDRYHGLASSLQSILLRAGIPTHIRETDTEGKV
jgi:hypothetical protein